MSVSDLLLDLGGAATRATLITHSSRRAFDQAVSSGEVVRLGRGRYGLPGSPDARAVAVLLGGAVSHESAALHHGWAVLHVPDRPHVTVSRGRVLAPEHARLAHVHIAELGPRDVVDGVTIAEVTLTACLRTCSFAAGLAIADSAVRDGFGRADLTRIADLARGPGSARMRRAARHADGRAANPFESGLRSICLSVPGLRVEPQVTVRDGAFTARPDLLDRRLLIAIEADSFAWHGGRRALASDARRYNRLVIAGWMVLRFSWEDVMFHPDQVREVLVAAVALAQAMRERTPHSPSAA